MTKISKDKIYFLTAVVIMVLLLLSIVKKEQDDRINAMPRNVATEEMSESYTNVYADIVSMNPRYFVTVYGQTIYTIVEIVCKCETVEGKVIWAEIPIHLYPEADSYKQDNNKSFEYSKSSPMRLKGSMTTSKRIEDSLESSIGNVFVLRVSSMAINK